MYSSAPGGPGSAGARRGGGRRCRSEILSDRQRFPREIALAAETRSWRAAFSSPGVPLGAALFYRRFIVNYCYCCDCFSAGSGAGAGRAARAFPSAAAREGAACWPRCPGRTRAALGAVFSSAKNTAGLFVFLSFQVHDVDSYVLGCSHSHYSTFTGN